MEDNTRKSLLDIHEKMTERLSIAPKSCCVDETNAHHMANETSSKIDSWLGSLDQFISDIVKKINTWYKRL